MPLCCPEYEERDRYLGGETRIKSKICTIYGYGDLFERKVRVGGPALVSFTVSRRSKEELKNAYVKLGNVPLGWLTSTPEEGIYVERLPCPNPFEWKISWPPLEKLVQCNRHEIRDKIKAEFGEWVDLVVEDMLV